jgi:hypothetical protein
MLVRSIPVSGSISSIVNKLSTEALTRFSAQTRREFMHPPRKQRRELPVHLHIKTIGFSDRQTLLPAWSVADINLTV